MNHILIAERLTSKRPTIIAALANIPRDTTSEGWAAIQIAFVELAFPKTPIVEVWYTAFQLYQDQRLGSVFWHEELCSGGASFILLPMQETAENAVTDTIAKLRRERDVVSLRVIRPCRWCVVDIDEIARRAVLPLSPTTQHHEAAS